MNTDLKKRTLVYCCWSDVEAFLCEACNADDPNSVRSELWNFWTSTNDNICNGSYNTLCIDSLIWSLKYANADGYGDWFKNLPEALTLLQKTMNNNDITIYYSW